MLALSLVDNTTMTSLSLRGNDLTSVAVQNFYSVLNSGENRTLRVLDISNNVGIDEDVSDAFETFMEQRAVKRMLTMQAEKGPVFTSPAAAEKNWTNLTLIAAICPFAVSSLRRATFYLWSQK